MKLGDTVYFDDQQPKKEPRRIVQIAAMPESERYCRAIIALCNDGSVFMTWTATSDWHEWEQLPEIPQ
jgi:hypothetical protein